jgi:DNA-binding response OmpR family regulator
LNKPTILCVDRYPSLLPTVVALLTSRGYQVLTATNIADGCEMLAHHPVDAVILDYTLCPHNHHGDDCVADLIHARNQRTKIVVWCADDSVQAQAPPCADVVFLKPVAAGELIAQLDVLLRS